jgi:hypothetical protein
MTIDIKTLTIREVAHYNGGKAFFAYGYECVQYPRLTLFKRFDKKLRTVTATWRVDGVDQASLEEAVEVLSSLEILDRVRTGQEAVHSAADVRKDLGLDDGVRS